MLNVTNLRLLRGNAVVLEDFSGTLAAGQGAWLLGANGSGKTSLLRACAGLLPPLAGSVETPDDKIFIGSALGHDAALSCLENLNFWCNMHNVTPSPAGGRGRGEGGNTIAHPHPNLLPPAGEGTTTALTVLALQQAGLAAIIHQPVATLSAGQSQRLALARLLCSAAPLWLLDEPFAALDTVGQAWLCGLITNHMQQGGVVLCATHQTYDVPAMQRWQL